MLPSLLMIMAPENGSDLIPELRKDTPELKKSALQFASLVLGVIPMVLILLLE